MIKDAKVYLASLLGFGAPSVNFFLDHIGTVLQNLVLLGQFGVAVVTILYIYSKWKKNHDDDKE